MASALLLTSCSKDSELFGGKIEGGNGNGNGGNNNPDSTAYFTKVTYVNCQVNSITWEGINAEVKTRAAVETPEATVVATVNHSVTVQKWFTTDGETKDEFTDTTSVKYQGTSKTKFFGLNTTRRAGWNVYAKNPVVTNNDGVIIFDWEGRKISVSDEAETIPAFVKVSHGEDTIRFTELCKINLIDFSYVGCDSIFDKEDGEFNGYNITLKFKKELEGGHVVDITVPTYLWIAKDGKDPNDPEEKPEVIKIEEVDAVFSRDTLRDETNLISNIYWSRTMKYYMSDGTDSLAYNVLDTTYAYLGTYGKELKEIKVGNISEYKPEMTMYHRGELNGLTRTIRLGINDEETSLLATHTQNNARVGDVERTLTNNAYYTDYKFVKDGSYYEQVSENEYIYYHKMVSEFVDGKMPQTAYWTRRIIVEDQLTSVELTSDWISLDQNKFFLNFEGIKHFSASGDKNFKSTIDLHTLVEDNGPIQISEVLDTMSIAAIGAPKVVEVNMIKTDTTNGTRTTVSQDFNVMGKVATVTVTQDEISKYLGQNVNNRRVSINKARVEKISSSKQDIYDLASYDLVCTISCEDKSFEHSVRIEEKVLNLIPTFDGYKIVRADVSLYYANGIRNPGQGVPYLCGYAVSLSDATQNIYFAIEVSSKKMTTWANVNLKEMTADRICSIIYKTGTNSEFEPANMQGCAGTNFANWKTANNGWDYQSLSNPSHVHGFYPITTNVAGYPNPYIKKVTENAEGYFEYDGNYLVSDKLK